MKITLKKSISIAATILVLSSCSQAQDASAELANDTDQAAIERGSKVLAKKDGLQLTEADFQKAIEIEMVLDELTVYPVKDQIALKAGLIDEFNENPKELLDSIAEVYADVGSGAINEDVVAVESTLAPENQTGGPIADGHHLLRENVSALSQGMDTASQFNEQSYDTPSVNQLRQFMANSQVVNSNYNDYSSSQSVYTFCANGTFQYYYGSSTYVGSSLGGMEASGTNEARAAGFWDAYQEGGNVALLIYSADPGFTDQSLNNTGLLALPIAAYQEDLIQLGQRGMQPTPDMLLSRTAISGC